MPIISLENILNAHHKNNFKCQTTDEMDRPLIYRRTINNVIDFYLQQGFAFLIFKFTSFRCLSSVLYLCYDGNNCLTCTNGSLGGICLRQEESQFPHLVS